MSRLETEPLTERQLGAVLGEFRRLGLDRPADRAERLAVSAELLGLDGLDSTRDLVMGEAGRLVSILRNTASRAELATLPAPAAEPETPPVLWWEVLRALLGALAGTACLP
ncbi:MAG TPA: hypothetical protein VGG25_29320 [Streptosporangiaceae bacterium]|jgi:hypothetical protein